MFTYGKKYFWYKRHSIDTQDGKKSSFFTDPCYQYICLFICFFSFLLIKKKKLVRSNCIKVHVRLHKNIG